MNTPIGQQIQSARKVRRLSQAELARRSGVCKATICQIETGRRFPSEPTLNSILSVLQAKVVIILKGGL